MKIKLIEREIKIYIAKYIWGFNEKNEVPPPNYSYNRLPPNRKEVEEFNAAFSSIHQQLKEKYSSLNKFDDF